MSQLVLYTTDGCHLCEQAVGMFYYAKQQSLIDPSIALDMVDIVSESDLAQKYGERIPVFFSPSTKQELGWPWELDDMVRWIVENTQG